MGDGITPPWTWQVWHADLFTWGWVVWIVYFFVWETLALLSNNNQELTEHLRPVFLSSSLTWFLALGTWLWLGWHFLLEAGAPLRVLSPE